MRTGERDACDNFLYIHIIYICLDFIQGACTESLARRPTPRSHYSPSAPMNLMTSQSLPPSSASSIMIMSHHIDLAGLGHSKPPGVFSGYTGLQAPFSKITQTYKYWK